MTETTVFVDGFHFLEGPRWRDGRLVVSDFYDHRVLAIDLDGTVTELAEVEHQPSGLGWLPDGRMLVVSMTDRRVLCIEESGELSVHAELGALATFHTNDMLVDDVGRAYVGNFGLDLHGLLRDRGEGALFDDPAALNTVLCFVDADGTVDIAASDLAFPNGMVLLEQGATLVVAETLASRLTAFDVDDAGRLSNRRVWADLSAEWITPDGICVDSEGCIWVANAIGTQAVRVRAGGEIIERVTTTQHCYAVALGGADGRTLFACTATDSDDVIASSSRSGRLETATVSVPA